MGHGIPGHKSCQAYWVLGFYWEPWRRRGGAQLGDGPAHSRIGKAGQGKARQGRACGTALPIGGGYDNDGTGYTVGLERIYAWGFSFFFFLYDVALVYFVSKGPNHMQSR